MARDNLHYYCDSHVPVVTGSLRKNLDQNRRICSREGNDVNLIQVAVIFLILALMFFIMGMRGIAGVTMEIAKWLVIIFVAVAIILLVL